jgi:transposase-like protein
VTKPFEIIGHGVWLYFRFPLRLRMVEELLAARGIIVSHETVRGRRANRKTAIGTRLPGIVTKTGRERRRIG